jgi:hypothetical protein
MADKAVGRPPPPAWGFLYIMEGSEAHAAGQPLTDNPYDPDTEESGFWIEGWEDDAMHSGASVPRTPGLADLTGEF